MTQTDIFTMFGLVDELAEQEKKEEELKRKKAEEERKKQLEEIKKKAEQAKENSKGKKASSSKKKEEEFKVNEDTIIRYYGESIPITNYFDVETLAEGVLVKKKDGESERKPITAEMLRKRMEKDYPELVASHTEIVYIPKKNIVIPTMKAKKKGCMKQELPIGSSCLPFPIPKKIPFYILRDFIAIARLYGEMNLEIHGDIYYHPEKKEYFLDIPRQIVNSVMCESLDDDLDILSRLGDVYKVLEIHSHHTMKPFPSAQDNLSERTPRMLYAIVGKIDDFFPQLYTRQFISEEVGHIRVNPELIFEYPFYELPEIDLSQVEVG